MCIKSKLICSKEIWLHNLIFNNDTNLGVGDNSPIIFHNHGKGIAQGILATEDDTKGQPQKIFGVTHLA